MVAERYHAPRPPAFSGSPQFVDLTHQIKSLTHELVRLSDQRRKVMAGEAAQLRDLLAAAQAELRAAEAEFYQAMQEAREAAGPAALSEVAAAFGVSTAAVLGRGRDGKLAAARNEVYYRLRYDAAWTLKEIGAFMGRDHSTVISGCRAAATRRFLNQHISIAEGLEMESD